MVANRQAGAGASSRPDTSFRQVVGGPPFAASRSQVWPMPVNDTVPLCPNTVRSHSSLVTSVSGVDSARRA